MTEKNQKTVIDYSTIVNFSISKIYYKLLSLT